MKFVKNYRYTLLIYLTILLCVLIFSQCVNSEQDEQPAAEAAPAAIPFIRTVSYTDYAGSETCSSCHKNIGNNLLHSAHSLTSQSATELSVKGSFQKGKNSFIYGPDRVVFLEKKEDSLYQVYYYKGDEHVRRRFDVVVGSGTKGQTYLSWVKHQLIELPVSYFTQVKQWANSPGYPLYPTLFNRPATTRCLECHSTFAATLTPPMQEPERFDSTKMILGITCERCHGPAAAHVAYQKVHPEDTVGKFIINLAKLSRQQNIDFCSLCHAGRLAKTQPSFTFQAGDTLSHFFRIDSLQSAAANIDVHGNQYGLLAASKCFKMSGTMTCVTCHDVHNNERGKMVLFSQRCLTCHTAPHKAVAGITNAQLVKNCIDCHMPLQPSQAIGFLLQGETMPTHANMRTHFITVYDKETKQFVESLKGAHR